MQIGDCDAYVNVAGGIKVQEPAMDLGIVMAIASSFRNRVIAEDVVVFGEVGLSGEVRAVSMAQSRVQEAKKLGFSTVILPESNVTACSEIRGIRLCGVRNVQEAIEIV